MTDEELTALADKIIERSNAAGHFSSKVGMVYESISQKGGTGYVQATKENCNPYGILHGGVYYTMMDHMVGMAACCSGIQAVTLDGSINYIRSAKLGDTVRCEVTAVNVGRTIAVYDARCYGADGRLQATGNFHLYFVGIPTTKLEEQYPLKKE